MEGDAGPSTPGKGNLSFDELKAAFAEERRKNAEVIKELEEEKRKNAEQEAKVAEQEAKAAEQEAKAAEYKAKAAEQEAKAAEYEAKAAKTTLFGYLSLIDKHVFGKFTVETNRNFLTQGSTSVVGKCCPTRLLHWSEFPTLHDLRFRDLQRVLDPLAPSFDSFNKVAGHGIAFSPQAHSEAALRPFVRVAIEKPAAAIVSAYLQASADKSIDHITFKDNDKSTYVVLGIADEPGQKRKKSSQPKSTDKSNNSDKSKGSTEADRWGLCVVDAVNRVSVRFLPGEYKAAHRLLPAKLQHILTNASEDFFFIASGVKVGARDDKTISRKHPLVYLAKALCQTYDYIVTSGLQYGYVATGTGLVLLHVCEEERDTLRYYCATFASETTNTQRQPLPPMQTAAAYLATLSLLALRQNVPTQTDMQKWAEGRSQWPLTGKDSNNAGDDDTPETDGGGEDGGDSDSDSDGDDGEQQEPDGSPDGSGRDKRARSGAGLSSPSSSYIFRTKKGGRGADQDDMGAATQTREWTQMLRLPYCTQACLLGVVRQLPLDDKCPNVHLHRAMALEKCGEADGHPLTVAGIHEQLLRQDKMAEQDRNSGDRRHVLQYFGLEGRYGTLLRVIVYGAGYSFVAKAAFRYRLDTLQHEQHVYDALSDCQGKLIPVCLGVLSTIGEITRYGLLSELLLLSYAGLDLRSPERMPCNVNLQEAMDRTAQELYDHGLRNRDVRVHNCAWNAETWRVFHFDFDQAYMESWEEEEEKEEKTMTTETHERVTSPRPETSPLLKRNFDFLCEGALDEENGHRKKQKMGGDRRRGIY